MNIRYYATAAAAAEAGFRPCLRCRPETAPNSPVWFGTLSAVRRGLRLIEEGFLDSHSVENLADRLGIGIRHLHRLFIRHVGASPITVAQTRRLHFAKHLLDQTSLPITEIALAAGFGSVRRFNDAFRKTYNRSPRELRKRREAMVDTGAEEIILHLAYRPPYDWTQVHNFFSARAIPGVEVVENGTYARTVATPNGWTTIEVRPLEVEHALELRVCGANPADLLHLATVARRIFDLAADPETIISALRDDPIVGPLVRRRPGLRVPGVWSPFECAVRAVVGQRVSVAAGRTFLARLVERAGLPISTPTSGLTHLFPTPRALVAAELEGLGLTTKRIATIKALSHAVLDGQLDFTGSVDQVVRALTDIDGIGDWSAQYVALRSLGDPNAFPSGDLALRRAASERGDIVTTSAIEQRSEAWRPWRAYAAVHLWCAANELLRDVSAA